MNKKDGNNNTWIKQDGFFISKIKEVMMNDDYSKEAINTILNNAIEIFLQCPNPIKKKIVKQVLL